MAAAARRELGRDFNRTLRLVPSSRILRTPVRSTFGITLSSISITFNPRSERGGGRLERKRNLFKIGELVKARDERRLWYMTKRRHFKVKRARKVYMCAGKKCGQVILIGTIYGDSDGTKFCRDCLISND